MGLTRFGDIAIEMAMLTCGGGSSPSVTTFLHVFNFLQHTPGRYSSTIPNLVNPARRNKEHRHFAGRTTRRDPEQCWFGGVYGVTTACSHTYSCIGAPGHFCCFNCICWYHQVTQGRKERSWLQRIAERPANLGDQAAK